MKSHFPSFLRITIFFFAIFGLMEFVIDSGDQPAFIKYPMSLLVLLVALVLLISLEMIVVAGNNITEQLLTDEQKKARETQKALPFRQRDWYKNLIQKLTKTRPIEDEAQLLLHHDYDGIRELDNNLPPWWVYSFYGCVAFAAIYLVHYELMDGQTQEQEFQKEMADAKIAVEEYKKNAPDLMDEKTVTLLTAAEDLSKGKEIYTANCVACHRADGGGQIGPNLTDNQWLLGGGIKNVFHTISEGGRDGKGMVAWRGTLKPKEIQLVASYIISLEGSNPKDAKAPEGDVYNEGTTDNRTASR